MKLRPYEIKMAKMQTFKRGNQIKMAEKTRNETAADEELKTLRERLCEFLLIGLGSEWEKAECGGTGGIPGAGIDDRGEGLFYRDNRQRMRASLKARWMKRKSRRRAVRELASVFERLYEGYLGARRGGGMGYLPALWGAADRKHSSGESGIEEGYLKSWNLYREWLAEP